MKGLTTTQANELLKQYGQNILLERNKKTIFVKFVEQFNNFLTILLISAATLSFIIGESVDGSLILAIVVLNALFGIYQEAKAEDAIAALKEMSVAKVRVYRDGGEVELLSTLLVPGDLCFVEEGTKIAADGIIVESVNLELNESVLTGESLPVVKAKGEEVYSGSLVAKGRGMVQITKTGMHTKFGEIAHNLGTIVDTQTPLQKKLEDLTRLIGIVGIAAAVIVFGISLAQGDTYFPAFLLAISLAVAVVPEGLPAVMTITLAMGVHEMSKKRSVVRKLSAIEALGSITLIATDKTGTLTTNKMKVKEVYVDDKLYESQLPAIENHPYHLMLVNGIVCSTASLVYKHDHGAYDVLGDPTEGALLFLAQDMGLVFAEVHAQHVVQDEQPFDSVTKRMSVIVESQKSKVKSLYTKGAPESILEICSSIQKGNQAYPLTGEERIKIEKQVEEWAKKGLRVLAFSYQSDQHKLVTTDQIFLGMVAIHDAPRPEVREAVQRANAAGIRVVMITGDNEKTAEAIGVTAGIVKEGDDILTGKQLEEYTDEELMQILPKTSIFARTSPFHKHRIVSLYQKLGEVVAVTGDGVNDAIALKQADVGVAMGLVGTDVARETADMVVTDDNFASIVTAVEEGRNIIKNLKNSIQYLLACNISEAITLIGGLLLGFNHILFPLQLLYINLVTDGFPALALSFSPRDTHLMQERPQQEMRLLKPKEQGYIALVGVATSVITLLCYWYFASGEGVDVAHAGVFTVLTLVQSFIFVDLWLSHRSLHTHLRSLLSPVFLAAFTFPFIAQLAIVRIPALAKVFNVGTLTIWQFIICTTLSASILLCIKGVKTVLKKEH